MFRFYLVWSSTAGKDAPRYSLGKDVLQLLPAGVVGLKPDVDAESPQRRVGGHLQLHGPLPLPPALRAAGKGAPGGPVGPCGVAGVGGQGVGAQGAGQGEESPASFRFKGLGSVR